jgi:hypothetical protein
MIAGSWPVPARGRRVRFAGRDRKFRRFCRSIGPTQWTRAYSGEHLIRRSGQVVQDHPPPVVPWADVPHLSAPVSRCPVAWQQYWQQPQGHGTDAQLRSSDGKPTRTTGPTGPRTGSGAAELHITRVFSCVAHGFKGRPSFMFAGCCRWRSSAVDGGSGTSRR